MKKLSFILSLFIILISTALMTQVYAQSTGITLESAYKREILFLNGQKRELDARQVEYAKNINQQIGKNQVKLEKLESELYELQKQEQKAQLELIEIEKDFARSNQDNEGLETLFIRAETEKSSDQDVLTQLDQIFSASLTHLKDSTRTRKTQKEVLDLQAQLKTMTVLSFGASADYALDEASKKAYLLMPAGDDLLKMGEEVPYPQFEQKQTSLNLFLHESSSKAYEAKKGKTLSDTMRAAGAIGWVIVGLGVITFFMVLFRAYLLYQNKNLSPEQMEQYLSQKELPQTVESNAFTRILTKLFQAKTKNKEELEGIASEQLVREWTLIDRFGTLIIVAASAAPLLGLLGTVTGMISTFDIITEFGTGDPKLLSSGISEALITTMLGLIVAIPALILGSLLSAQSEKRKSQMEEMVLNFLNQFKSSSQELEG